MVWLKPSDTPHQMVRSSQFSTLDSQIWTGRSSWLTTAGVMDNAAARFTFRMRYHARNSKNPVRASLPCEEGDTLTLCSTECTSTLASSFPSATHPLLLNAKSLDSLKLQDSETNISVSEVCDRWLSSRSHRFQRQPDDDLIGPCRDGSDISSVSRRRSSASPFLLWP